MTLLRRFRPRRISLRMFLVALPLIVAFSVLVILLGSREHRRLSFEAAADKARGIAHMTAFGLGPALFFEDSHTINEVVQSAKQNKELAYIVVLDASGRTAAEFNAAAAPRPKAAPAPVPETGYFSPDRETYHIATSVVYGDREVGRLLLGLSLGDALRAAAIFRGKLILIGLGLLLSGLASVFLVSIAITKPLRRVSETARRIALGDMTVRAPVMSLDESGHLAMAFNDGGRARGFPGNPGKPRQASHPGSPDRGRRTASGRSLSP
jgi:HAMP domain-containing protein